jgi:rhodanese-related sulfurtransferase
MSSYTSISADKLSRLIGTAHTPTLIDVSIDQDFDACPRVIPGAVCRPHLNTSEWASELTGRPVIVICQKGQKLGEGVAAWLRHSSVAAEILEGGFVGRQQANLPTVPYEKLPARDGRGLSMGGARWTAGRGSDPEGLRQPVARKACLTGFWSATENYVCTRWLELFDRCVPAKHDSRERENKPPAFE